MTDYEKYQLQWMIDHNHSLGQLMKEIEKYYDFRTYLVEVFSDWEMDSGFGGEIWACEEEWKDAEVNV